MGIPVDVDLDQDRKTVRTLVILAFMLILAIVFSVSRVQNWPHVTFHDDFLGADMLNLLSVLFFLALIQERALEVFVSTVRQPDAAIFERKVKNMEDELAAEQKKCESPNTTDKTETEKRMGVIRSDLRAARAELDTYRNSTMRFTLTASLVAGIFVSIAGARTLGHVFAIEFSEAGNGAYWAEFTYNAVDVFLTGAVIAGGSDGIHKMMNVVTNFLDSWATLAKKMGDPKEQPAKSPNPSNPPATA